MKFDAEVGWVSGACMLLRTEALGDYIFDERYFLYGEDLDLCDRLTRAGWKILYTPAAQIVHYDGRSLAVQNPEVQTNKLKSLREFFISRNGRRRLWFYDVVVAAGFLIRSAAFEVAARLRPEGAFGPRAAQSRRFLAYAWRNVLHRR